MTQNLTPCQKEIITYMLEDQDYDQIRLFLVKHLKGQVDPILPVIDLARSILIVDMDQVETLALQTNLNFLIKPTQIQRKVYFYTHHLNLQIKKREYADYFRGLTPVLVDILRLLVEHDFMPNLNEFMIPVIKNTPDDKPLYRGLQWFEKKIEGQNNMIKSTFKKYYGDRFNYDHYVSSSHLIKLIDDHSKNEDIKHKTNQMRLIEKYLRNLIAHEVVCVDEAWVQQRVNMTPLQVHELYMDLVHLAGLTNPRQWDVFEEIEQRVRHHLKLNNKEIYHEKTNH